MRIFEIELGKITYFGTKDYIVAKLSNHAGYEEEKIQETDLSIFYSTDDLIELIKNVNDF